MRIRQHHAATIVFLLVKQEDMLTPAPGDPPPVLLSRNGALQAMLAVTEGQQDALNLRDLAVLLCLADTGCRRGGLAGLTRGQLSLAGQHAQLMGHADISVTLAHYAHFVPDELQVFHRRFGSLSDLLPGEEALADRAGGAKDGVGAEALADRACGVEDGVVGEGSAPDKAGKYA